MPRSLKFFKKKTLKQKYENTESAWIKKDILRNIIPNSSIFLKLYHLKKSNCSYLLKTVVNPPIIQNTKWINAS